MDCENGQEIATWVAWNMENAHCAVYMIKTSVNILFHKKIDDWGRDEFLVSSVDPLEHEAVYIEQYSQGNIAFPYVVINHDH